MKPVKEIVKEGELIVLTEGETNNFWFIAKSFIHLIYFILNRGAHVGTHLYIFNPATGKDVFISITQQKTLKKQRGVLYNTTRQQLTDLAGLLGMSWCPKYAAYLGHYLAPKPKYSYSSYPDTWLKEEWSKQEHAEVQCDSV